MNDLSFQEPLSDADFTELLIRHMALLPEVFNKAKHLKLVGEDLMLDNVYGNVLYKELIDLINSSDTIPVSANALFLGLKRKFEDGSIDDNLKENTFEFLQYIYDESRPLERPEFFDSKLVEFVKKKRAQKLLSLYKDDVVTLTRELNKLTVGLSTDSPMSKPRIINPFVDVVYKTKTSMIGTGLSRLDEKLDGGLLRGEYAMLIGFSGGGKTACGSNMVGISAEMGRPSTYISCEEHEDEISQRFYSRVFRIPYRQLRQGTANIELESKFNDEMTRMKKESLAKHLCLIGLKGVDEDITADYLYEVLLQHYEKTGFVPELTMLDQLQFITPATNLRKGIATWEVERVVAAELDELSHRQIGGKSTVLWVQHQAKGRTKSFFTRDEIDGFKGIIQKTDLVLGVGRANERSNEINLFPLKVRHSADFKLSLKTEFEYMTVTSTEVRDTLGDQEPTSENPTMTPINHTPIILQ
jgi:hypothetical protein